MKRVKNPQKFREFNFWTSLKVFKILITTLDILSIAAYLLVVRKFCQIKRSFQNSAIRCGGTTRTSYGR